jgi:hypothetical protein
VNDPAQRPPDAPRERSASAVFEGVISEVLLFALALLFGLGVGSLAIYTGAIPGQSMLLGSVILAVASAAYLTFERLLHDSVPVSPLVPASARKGFGASVMIWAGGVVVALLGSTLLGIVQEQLGVEVTEQDAILDLVEQGDPTQVAMLAISAVVLAPLTEELLFRHLFFRRLMQRAGRAFGFVLPAVAFSLFHFNPSGLLIYAWLGLVFAAAYLFSGRFAVAVAVHAGHNAFALAMLLYAPDGVPGVS